MYFLECRYTMMLISWRSYSKIKGKSWDHYLMMMTWLLPSLSRVSLPYILLFSLDCQRDCWFLDISLIKWWLCFFFCWHSAVRYLLHMHSLCVLSKQDYQTISFLLMGLNIWRWKWERIPFWYNFKSSISIVLEL